MSIHLLFAAIDGAAFVLLALVAGRFLPVTAKSPNAWYVVMLGLVGMAYIVSSRQDYAPLLPEGFALDLQGGLVPLNLLRNLGAGVFTMLCYRIFRDDRPIPPVLIGIVVVQLFLEEPLAWLVGPQWALANPRAAVGVYEVAPAVLQISLLAFALYLMLAERGTDLIEARRQTRLALLLVYGALVALSLVVERIGMELGLVPVPAMYPIHMTQVAIGLVATITILLGMTRADLTRYIDPLQARQPPADPGVDMTGAEVAQVRAALESEHIYRTAGLSIADLAAHLQLPEYRLRRLIHEHMGFRNFNALLHHYRIAEVRDALADPARQGVPVLTLALSAGYQSLTPFNRAFRELEGMTPTEYRQRARLNRAGN